MGLDVFHRVPDWAARVADCCKQTRCAREAWHRTCHGALGRCPRRRRGRVITDPEIYRKVLEELTSGVYFVSRDERIAFWNRGAEQLTGYLSQQVLGHHMGENFLEHVDGANRRLEGTELPLMAALREGQEREARVTVRHKAGHPVPVRLRAVPLRDETGRLVGAAEYFDRAEAAPWQENRSNVLQSHGCTDGATGALTRAYMETLVHEHLETFDRHQIPFGVLAIAVDGLELMRTRQGAPAVAAVLKLVGNTLRNSLREPDQVGRWTETEFLGLITECSERDVMHVGQRLLKHVSAAEAEWWGDHLRVTISAGVAGARPGDTAAGVVQRAEEALRAAVAAGGNRVVSSHA